MKQRTILHIDINSYFATILQQENPKLRGKPIGVVKDVGRTCIIAASKEAKKYGVKTGSMLDDARILCPDIVTIPATFDRYLNATVRLKKIFVDLSPKVEIYSLDEAFVDITDCRQHLYPNPHQLGRKIQQSIKRELGEWVTASVGISYNRLLAKMASEIMPPESVFEINQDNLDSVLAAVPFKDVCGIGYRLERKLLRLGITNPYLIRLHPREELELVFGPFWSKELLKIAYGEEPHFLQLIDKKQPHMKSVGRSITGYRLYDSENEIKQVIYNLIEEVTHKARQLGLAGRQPSIQLYGSARTRTHTNSGNQSWGRHLTLPRYISHAGEMFSLLYYQLYKNWQRSFQVIKFAVRLSLLKPISQVNLSLLPRLQQQDALSKAKDFISSKYGLFTLRSGLLLNAPLIRPEVTGFLGDKSYYNMT